MAQSSEKWRTEVDRRTWLHVPSGTPWSTSSDTRQEDFGVTFSCWINSDQPKQF